MAISPSPIRLVTVATLGLLLGAAGPALAAVTLAPSAVTARPGEATPVVGVTLTFPPLADPGSGTLTVVVTGALSGHATVDPSPVTYDWASLETSASTGFRLLLAATAPPGSYAVTVIDDTRSAGSANLVVTVEQPEFDFQVVPGQLTLAPGGAAGAVTVTTLPEPGFAEVVTYALAGFPAFIQGPPVTAAPPAYPDRDLLLSALAGAAPGTYSGSVRATAPGLAPKTLPLTVVVAEEPPAPPPPPTPPSPGFTFRVSPDRVTTPLGGRGARVTVTTETDPGFTAPVTYALAGLPGFLEVGSAQTATPPSYGPRTFRVVPGADARVGTFTGVVRATGPNFATRTRPLTVTVGEPELSFGIEPDPVELRIRGGEAAVSVTTAARGLRLPVTYTFRGLPRFVLTGGSGTSRPPAFRPVGFRFSLGAGARPGSFDGFLEARIPGAPPRRRPVRVRVLPPLPRVERVSPPAVAAGSLEVPVRIHGRDFAPGATIVSEEPFVRFGAVRFRSPSLLEVEVSATSDAGRRLARLRVRNPDGATSPRAAPLAVVEQSSLSAPLAVHTAAVLWPLPGAHVGRGEALYPRGVLGVAGTGTVVGAWLLDGVPFDRFVVRAEGGEPVRVEAKLPIPGSPLGQHRLELAVERPQQLLSEPVPLLQVRSRASALRLRAPRDGRVVPAGTAPRLRWTEVPGASGYLVEVRGASREPGIRAVVGEAGWRPSAAELARLGPGIVRWRVRVRMADGAAGPATQERRLTLLPERVKLELHPPGPDGPPVLRWRGGAPGLLYRIDSLDAAGGPVRFSALSVRQRYRPPSRLPTPRHLRVTALGPRGRELGRSPVIRWSRDDDGRGGAGHTPASAPSPRRVLERAPETASTVVERRPRIAARWSDAIAPDELLLVVDSTDVTALSELGERSVVYRPPLPLEAGPHHVTLWLGDEAVEWDFEVDADEGEAEEPGEEPRWGDWRLDLEGSLNHAGGDGPVADATVGHAALSAAIDVQGARGFARMTGDLSARRDFTEGDGSQTENRSWVAGGGTPRREGAHLEAEGGYVEPAFLAGSELLALGLPKGGLGASARSGPLELSYHETFEPELAGLVTGVLGPEQEVRSASVGRPGTDGPFAVRVVGLEVDESDGDLSFGGEGSVVGVLGSYRGVSGAHASLELARSAFEPAPGSLEEGGDGIAGRLALDGRAGGFDLGLRLRFTDEEFVNPASRGLRGAAVPDRIGGELTVGRTFRRGSASLTYRHLQGGSGTGPPATRQDGAEVTVSRRVGEVLTLDLGTHLTSTRGDADAELLLPAVEQTDWGARLGIGQSLGALTVSQDLSFQETVADDAPERFSEVAQAGVSVSGRVAPGLTLFGQVSAVRNRHGAARRRDDSLLVSLQPLWRVARIGLSIQPYLSYNRLDSDLAEVPTETESYRLTLSWDAPWLRSLLSVQLTGDWSRSRGPGTREAGFTARYTAALTLRWDWDSDRRGSAASLFSGRGTPGRGAAPPVPRPVLASSWLAAPGRGVRLDL